MLTRDEFDVLVCLDERDGHCLPQEIVKACNISLASVEKTIDDLTRQKYICDGAFTDSGRAALAPYKVKRAIFLAAGFGSRLVPVTLNTPKPLVRVHGKPMIETLLDAVVAAGIPEIIIVRGYLREQFDVLTNKYPNVRFVDNPFYNEANNISSAYLVRDLLQNSYVLEADLVLRNPRLISKYQYMSNYLGVKTEKTDDWCFQTSENKIVKMCVGGTNCHHMYGISYWNAADGAKLSGHIKDVMEMPNGKDCYWDQVALEYFIKEYHIEVRPCTFDDIAEIDSFSELKKIDKTYDC